MARVLVLCVCLAAAACGGGAPGEDAPLEAGPDAEAFALTGRVVSVEASERKVTVAHDEVEDFMAPMTMQLTVKERWALETMAPGDHIAATLVVDAARSWLEGVVVTRGPGVEGAGVLNPPGAPEPGAGLPRVRFVDQDERPVDESDFTDRVSVVTFIYTRCPLPDYCPLMVRRFTEAAEALAARPAGTPPAQLVAVTLDPEYDTPAVLQAYAARVAPADAVAWRFLTGKADQVRTFATFFGLSYEAAGGEIMHALRTAVIDPDGRVAAVLRGSEWTADELVEQVLAAANGVPPGR